MRLRVLGCSGGSAPGRQLTSLVIDGVLAMDAGALTTTLEIPEQRRLKAVVLTHAHLDHIWSLPLCLANRFADNVPTCEIVGNAFTIDALHDHQLNNRVWPDFSRAATRTGPVMSTRTIEPGETITLLDRYELQAVAMNHAIPCQGYLIRDGNASFLLGADTHISDPIWALANATDDLQGMIVECSFPSSYADLARRSKHLTPALLGEELTKLTRDIPVYVTHLKPGYEAELHQELDALGDARIRVLQLDQTIDVA